MARPTDDAVIYRYPGEGGDWIYVNDLSFVPKPHRDAAERVVLSAPTTAAKEGEGKGLDLSGQAAALEAEVEGALQALPKKAREVGRQGRRSAEAAQREIGDVVPFVKELDLPSVAVGFAMALGFWLLSLLIRRSGRLLFKVGLVLAMVALVAGAYFGWLRRTAGLSDGHLASPAAVVDDAKKAAKQMQDRLQKNERILKKLEETSR